MREHRYMSGEDILSICASVDFPPCMMLRRMLESLLLVNKQVRCGSVAQAKAAPLCRHCLTRIRSS